MPMPEGYDPVWDDVDCGSVGPMYFDRQGVPISLRRFVELFEDREYRVLADDTVGAERAMTVWLALDDDCGFGDGPPMIFGSMILGRPDSERLASSEAEALANHQVLLAELRLAAS